MAENVEKVTAKLGNTSDLIPAREYKYSKKRYKLMFSEGITDIDGRQLLWR